MCITNIENLNIRFEIVGSQLGKDLILLHGWGTNLHTFDPIANELAKEFKIYKLDFPGFGESDPPKSVWGVENYTNFIEKFVQDNNINNPIIIGHSFGGRVALLYASRNEVSKLILIDAAGVKPKRTLKYFFKVYSYKIYKNFLPLLIGKTRANKNLYQYRKRVGSGDYNNSTGIMRNVLVKVVNEDLKHVMPKIKAPTLLIWGENDTATPIKDAKIMEQRIKDCGLVILKNAGHFSFLDKPYEVSLIINSFLGISKIKK